LMSNSTELKYVLLVLLGVSFVGLFMH
jgi:hypothetical protein